MRRGKAMIFQVPRRNHRDGAHRMRGARRCLHVAPDSRLELLAEWRRSEGGARSVPQTPARIWRNAPFHLAGQKRFSSSSLIENEKHLASLNRCFPYSLFDEQLEKAQILRNGGVFVHTAPPARSSFQECTSMAPPRVCAAATGQERSAGPAPPAAASRSAPRWPRPVCAQQQPPGKSASLAPSPAPTADIHDDEGGDDLRHPVPCAHGSHRLTSPSPYHQHP